MSQSPRRFVKEYNNSTVYHEPGDTEDETKIVTHTRRRIRKPGTEDLQDNYRHWRVYDENSTKIVSTAPSSYRSTPSWSYAIDDFPRDENHSASISACHACTCAAGRVSHSSEAPAPRVATPGPSRSGAQGRLNRALRQASIMPYLIGRSSRMAAGRTRAPSPGSHISCPIVIADSPSPAAAQDHNDRNHTRHDTRGLGSIIFQAGTVRFALAPNLHPTMVAVVQYPLPEPGPVLEFEPSAKRKYVEEEADRQCGNVFSTMTGRSIQQNAFASSSTTRVAIPTSSGHKRLCVETQNGSDMSSSVSPPLTASTRDSSWSPSPSPTPSFSLTPRASSLTPTASSVASAAWKGKARAR